MLREIYDKANLTVLEQSSFDSISISHKNSGVVVVIGVVT